MQKKYSCVLFDLDGTLLNTNKLIIESFKFTLKQHLNISIEEEELYQFFGEPLRITLARFDSDNVEEMLSTYRKFNIENHDSLTTVFPNAIEVVEQLSKEGFKIGIVTSKLKKTALKGLAFSGLNRFVETLVAYEDTQHHKPEAAPIIKALSKLKHPTEGTIMVGDSPFDLRSAKNAGVHGAGVSWSVHTEELLLKEEPQYIIKKFPQLLEICLPSNS